MILFTSDYTEGAHPRIIEKLAETNMEQTVGYGEDPYCEEAREAIKKVCEAPEADYSNFFYSASISGSDLCR